jgi:hypothetical protein
MVKIIFLHHSTGKNIWLGNASRYVSKLFNKSDVGEYFKTYNKAHGTEYVIAERNFPKESPYGWNNYPYDYYNIWVKNAGEIAYLEEPTLEILTKEFDVIIFKHCYPVSRIGSGTSPDINSDVKTLQNYKLQYNALKMKMREFPETKFIVWTPAVMIEKQMTRDEAIRTKEFCDWLLNEWSEGNENIFIWDFYKYETEGGLYLQDGNADSPDNSHPGKEFSARMAPLFSQFVIDVIEGKLT